MANLAERRTERGQILLVAAFLLAVTFVTLALVVNSAIFTENLATRDDVAGSHDALEGRYEVQTEVGHLLEGVNNITDPSPDDTALINDMQAELANTTTERSFHKSTQGQLVNVNYKDETVGAKFVQTNASRNFTSDSYKEDWNVTTEAEFAVRQFEINVTDPGKLEGSDIDAFQVYANDTSSAGSWWNMTVFEDGTDNVEVRVEHADYTGVASCTRKSVETVRIDITGGTVGGESCAALDRLADGTEMWFGTSIDDSYRIRFRNSDNIQGTYSFIANQTTLTPPSDSHPSENIVDEDILYSVTVGYTFYTSAVKYETDIRIAPGEVPP